MKSTIRTYLKMKKKNTKYIFRIKVHAKIFIVNNVNEQK